MTSTPDAIFTFFSLLLSCFVLISRYVPRDGDEGGEGEPVMMARGYTQW